MSQDHPAFIFPLGRSDDRPSPQAHAWYDTREGLEARVESGGLEGLREIATARRNAGYGRGERMAEWCLLGRFYTDTCGNFSALTQGAPADAYQFMEYDGPLPTVLSKEEMGTYTHRWVATMQSALPPQGARCDRCGRGWDLDNVRDFYWHRSDQPPRHESCQQLKVIQDEIKEIGDVVCRAKIPFSDVYMIPNEYSRGDPSYFGPWFMVETPRGRVKIGWRKRVINIDWGETAIQLPSGTFEDEDVTKGATFIHAWGTDKAVQYLRKIWEAGG